jgi:asparagine synthase (glutamine-hydrolysing)
MIYRGPDDAGLYISENGKIGLGHRRLSIIDLSPRAKQPMSNENRTIWIVFNGEIYNYRYLRKKLKEKGHIFKSCSDTEVIIHLYEEKGIDCVNDLEGMFAFALWDEKEEKLFLVRDRIGIKPLYYAVTNDRFIFASEIKALFMSNELVKEINPESIYHYLTFLTVLVPNTMFKNIYKVEAGTILKIDKSGQICKTRYWNPANFLNKPLRDGNEDEIIKTTEDLLKEAISLRLISDVPLSATFSGGVDSSLIVSLMREQTDNVLAMTMDYEIESHYSETKIAKLIANRLDISLDERKVTSEDYFKAVNDFLKIQSDYPAGDPNIILLYVISKLTKESGVTVCLVGEGGDEIGGYPIYLDINNEFKILKHFSSLPSSFKKGIYNLCSEKIKGRLGIALGNSVVSRRHIHAFTEEEKKKMWLGDKVSSSYLLLETFMDEIDTKTEDEFLRKVLNVEFKLRLPELILPRVDYPTMANSIEARVPLLDHKLVEYSLRLPSSIKMKNDEAKYILKRVLCNYIDKKYVYRKKVGFGMLLTPFLKNILPNWFKNEILDKNNHPLFAYIDKKYLLRLHDEHKKRKNNGFKMWTIYALGKWLEIHA